MPDRSMGEKIKRLRKKAGYRSADDLAAAVGVSANTVYRWERGQVSDPEGPNAISLARVLGIGVDELFGAAEDVPTRHPALQQYLESEEGARAAADHRMVEKLERADIEGLHVTPLFYHLLFVAYESGATPEDAIEAAKFSHRHVKKK